jgi:nicotinamidase-related amidase
MFNSYDHVDAEPLIKSVAEIIDPLADLVSRARDRDDIELVYVNDNHGDFASGRDDLVQRAVDGRRGDLVKPILPTPECSFLTKVRHSAFYSTPLGYFLNRLGAERLVLAGQVTEQCVLYTALDAYVRHYPLRVVTDAVAHIDRSLGDAALTMMERNMQAELVSAYEALG